LNRVTVANQATIIAKKMTNMQYLVGDTKDVGFRRKAWQAGMYRQTLSQEITIIESVNVKCLRAGEFFAASATEY